MSGAGICPRRRYPLTVDTPTPRYDATSDVVHHSVPGSGTALTKSLSRQPSETAHPARNLCRPQLSRTRNLSPTPRRRLPVVVPASAGAPPLLIGPSCVRSPRIAYCLYVVRKVSGRRAHDRHRATWPARSGATIRPARTHCAPSSPGGSTTSSPTRLDRHWSNSCPT
jgi:hypothetical protein